jgi:uncharacterized protein (DUF58 family)
MQIRGNFWIILFVLTASIAGAAITHAGIFNRLLIFTAALIILAWVWAKISTSRIRLTRQARGERQQMGQIFEEQFIITNLFPLSKAWIEIEDASRMLSTGSTRVVSAFKSNSVRNFSGYTMLSKRGEYALSPTILYSGDPFGLFLSRRVFETREQLLVLPMLIDIHHFPLPGGLVPGGSSLRRRTREIQPPNAAGIREYAPGDSLNRIHWPTTARRDRWMVKEFEQDPQSDIWILLDAQTDVHVHDEIDELDLDQIPLWWLHRSTYKLPRDTFEYAACLAGSIARYFSRSGQVVGFASQPRRRIVLSSERGERQLKKILKTLSLINPDGRDPVNILVESETLRLPRGCTVILITPSTNPSLMNAINTLIRRGINPLVILIDPSSFGKYYGTSEMISQLNTRRVPSLVIRYGDGIKETIERGFS